MELPINPDPQKLHEDKIFGGRKWWQWICIICAIVLAVVIFFILGDKMNSTFSSIIIAVIVVPMLYIGVFKKNNLDFFEFYRHKKANSSGANTFYYHRDIPESKRNIDRSKKSKRK